MVGSTPGVRILTHRAWKPEFTKGKLWSFWVSFYPSDQLKESISVWCKQSTGCWGLWADRPADPQPNSTSPVQGAWDLTGTICFRHPEKSQPIWARRALRAFQAVFPGALGVPWRKYKATALWGEGRGSGKCILSHSVLCYLWGKNSSNKKLIIWTYFHLPQFLNSFGETEAPRAAISLFLVSLSTVRPRTRSLGSKSRATQQTQYVKAEWLPWLWTSPSSSWTSPMFKRFSVALSFSWKSGKRYSHSGNPRRMNSKIKWWWKKRPGQHSTNPRLHRSSPGLFTKPHPAWQGEMAIEEPELWPPG